MDFKQGEESMDLPEISRAITIDGAEIEVNDDTELTPELEEELRYIQSHQIGPLEIEFEAPMQMIRMNLIFGISGNWMKMHGGFPTRGKSLERASRMLSGRKNMTKKGGRDMQMTEEEIKRNYTGAKNKRDQIKVLAELNCTST